MVRTFVFNDIDLAQPTQYNVPKNRVVRKSLSHHPLGYYVIDNNTARAYNTKELYSIYVF
jgi:hypothetical protein